MSNDTKFEKTAIFGAFSFFNALFVQICSIAIDSTFAYKSIVLTCTGPVALIVTYLFYVYIKVNHYNSVEDRRFSKEIKREIAKYTKLSVSKQCSSKEKSHYLAMKHKLIKEQSEHTMSKVLMTKEASLNSKNSAAEDVIRAVSPSSKKPKAK